MAFTITAGQQYDKQHAITLKANGTVAAGRFISFLGIHANNSGGANDVQGASENPATEGNALSVITGYSALVEAAEDINFGAFVTVGSDNTGRAIVGSILDYCGRAISQVSAGHLVEVVLMPHVHALGL